MYRERGEHWNDDDISQWWGGVVFPTLAHLRNQNKFKFNERNKRIPNSCPSCAYFWGKHGKASSSLKCHDLSFTICEELPRVPIVAKGVKISTDQFLQLWECLWILKNQKWFNWFITHSLLDSPKKKQVQSGYQYLWKQNKYRNTWNNNEQLILRWINLSFDFW